MAVKLYIQRHGSPCFADSVKRYMGRTDVSLSPQGMAQAEQGAARLMDRGIGMAYTSPLSRCREFAEIIADKLGLPSAIELPGLLEINMGNWEYLPVGEIKDTRPEDYKARGLDLAGFVPEGGESFRECQIRAVKTIGDIAAAGQDAVVITHAGFIRSLLCYAENHDLNDLFYYDVPYGGIFMLDYGDELFKSIRVSRL
ncbi:MAG: histidine phosphatase family protein [Treponema sp.]|nr:histidine phosphatase family protein [Treponema sp.]